MAPTIPLAFHSSSSFPLVRTLYKATWPYRRSLCIRSPPSRQSPQAHISPTAPPPNDHQHMRSALIQAQHAFDAGEVPVGAVLLSSDGIPLSAAHNNVETLCDVTAHAEILALRRASAITSKLHGTAWRLSGATLYSTLEPCPMCLSALSLARVSRVVYAAPDLRLGACGSWINLTDNVIHPYHSFDEVVGGVLEDEAAQLLKNFFRQRRKSPHDKP